jgi:hypothetical protein
MAKTTRKTRKTADESVINMAVTAAVDTTANDDDAILAAMLAADDEIVETAASDDEIMAVAASIEKAESIEALYADDAAAADVIVAAADVPATDAAVVTEKKAKAPKAPKAPKVPRITRVTGKESAVLAAKLGDKVGDFLVLETADAALDADALKAKQDDVLTSIDALAKKVGEKATMLFGWMKNGGTLNEVMKRTFTVMARDGELTSGNKGNLQTDLLSKPYSPGTSASQANQMFMLLPALKITIKEKGKMVPNPDSLIYMKAKAELGLA